MTDAPNKIIPNSFQTPNFFVDECMAYLSGNEIKCVIVLSRKTFGWQKRSDRISKPQLIEATGLNGETLDGCMNYLMTIGLVLRLHENNARNEGIEWALQLDDEQIRFDLLKERKAKQEETQQKRTQKARDTIAQMRGGLSDSIHKSQLKPKKRTWALTRPRALLCQHPNSVSIISQRIAGRACGSCLRSSTCCRRKNQPPQPRLVTLDFGSTAFEP